jgi:2-polyprenyl-3-methyl-5-hydroxy-6-metoxy-1,4-benzoquinol methylase
LSFFKKKGFKVVGIDPANNIVSDCKKQNIELINDFFNYRLAKKLKKKHSCELITANNVLANIPNINSFFKGISFLLNDNGYFIFETIYGPDIIKNKYIDMINSEHLYYFSLKSLSYLLKKNNLKIIKIKKSKIKGGSIRIYSKKIDSVKLYSENMNVKNILEKEKKMGFHNYTKLKKINIEYIIYKKKIRKFLKNLKKNKNKIFGYGASAGATTILHFLEMKNYIDFIIDDNPLRKNLYSPGYKIKVFSSNKIYSDKPNYIFIFAWRYHKKIIEKNKYFKRLGGKFIIPLPNLKII